MAIKMVCPSFFEQTQIIYSSISDDTTAIFSVLLVAFTAG